MNFFLKKMERRITSAIEKPQLIKPFLENKAKDFFTKPHIKKLLEQHEAEFVTRGTSKEVYKVPFHFLDGVIKDYAVAFIPKPISCDENSMSCVERMRLTRQWYQDNLGNQFINDEKLLASQNNKDIIIYVQPWIDFDENEKDLFYDIPKNLESILHKMKSNKIFMEQMRDFSEKIVSLYRETGFIPDLFNSMTAVIRHNPANLYVKKDGTLVFIDTHTLSHDARIGYSMDDSEKNLMIMEIVNNEEKFAYIDKLIDSFEKISECCNS